AAPKTPPATSTPAPTTPPAASTPAPATAPSSEPVEAEPPATPDDPEPPADPADVLYRATTVTYDSVTRAVKLDGNAVIERAGRPDCQLLSAAIVIHKGRAELTRPTRDLLGLAIPIFVPISLPLTDRQTGLLAPRFGYALITGFGIVEPVFVTLGRSWDVTLA